MKLHTGALDGTAPSIPVDRVLEEESAAQQADRQAHRPLWSPFPGSP